MIPVIARHPAALKRTETPDPMAAWLRFAEGQDNMQMVFAPWMSPGETRNHREQSDKDRTPATKAGSAHQADWTSPRVLPDQDVILLQHQRQTIDTAKTDDFYALKKHILRYTTTLLQ
nr:Uncharacterised protein [Klebsiella pneumoniae]